MGKTPPDTERTAKMMKFTCNTQLLSQSINSAMLAVSPKSTLLALEGILVRAAVR